MEIRNFVTGELILHLDGDTLEGAGLNGADLRRADLAGANLRGAHLEGTHLNGADLRNADLTGAQLRGAHLRDARLAHAHLQGADLSDADLINTRFEGANLNNSTLDRSNLWGSDLSGSMLRGASLREACVWDVDFLNADLSDTDLSGSICDGFTRWPEGFDPIARQVGRNGEWEVQERWPKDPLYDQPDPTFPSRGVRVSQALLTSVLERWVREVLVPLEVINQSPLDLPPDHPHWALRGRAVRRYAPPLRRAHEDETLVGELRAETFFAHLQDLLNTYEGKAVLPFITMHRDAPGTPTGDKYYERRREFIRTVISELEAGDDPA